jgi:hypothetical protein
MHSHPEVVGCGLARESNVLHVDVAQLLGHVGDSTEKSGYVTLTRPDGLETRENGTRSSDHAHPRQRPPLRMAM